MKIWFLVALSCTIVVLLATAGCTQTFEPQPTPSPAPTTIPAELTNRSADPCCYHPGSCTDSTCPPPFTPDEHQRHAIPSSPSPHRMGIPAPLSGWFRPDIPAIIKRSSLIQLRKETTRLLMTTPTTIPELTDSLTIFWLCRNPSLN